MSGPAGPDPGRARRARLRSRPILVVLGVVLVAVLIALVAGPGRTDGPPLDPASTGPDGLKGLVEILRAAGADVTVGSVLAPEPGGSILVLADNLTATEERSLTGWVRQGGNLVVADPRSPLAEVAPAGPVPAPIVGRPTLTRRACDVVSLRDVARIDPAGGEFLHVPDGTTGCFPGRGGAFVVVRSVGDGTVAILGGPGPLTNGALGHDDNSVLAVDLLGAGPGTRVIIATAPVGAGRRSLLDLVSWRVRLALLQLALAFGVVVLWRARRLGRVAAEPQAVRIDASELVAAVGHLLHQGRRRDEAARLLRAELARRTTDRLGLPEGATSDQLADTVAQRTGLDRDVVRRALEPGPMPDDPALLALARAADEINAEVSLAR